MALEVASVLPPRANVLDVGCGNGFIAHHLQGMLGTTVVGLDVGQQHRRADQLSSLRWPSFSRQRPEF